MARPWAQARATGREQVVRHADTEGPPIMVTVEGGTGRLLWPRMASPLIAPAVRDMEPGE
jgi:hypothetical protein